MVAEEIDFFEQRRFPVVQIVKAGKPREADADLVEDVAEPDKGMRWEDPTKLNAFSIGESYTAGEVVREIQVRIDQWRHFVIFSTVSRKEIVCTMKLVGQ